MLIFKVYYILVVKEIKIKNKRVVENCNILSCFFIKIYKICYSIYLSMNIYCCLNVKMRLY